jgi:hypothetical protein
MTHERERNLEGGHFGQDWLEDAASEEPAPLLVEAEVGGAALPEWDADEQAEYDEILARIEAEQAAEVEAVRRTVEGDAEGDAGRGDG